MLILVLIQINNAIVNRYMFKIKHDFVNIFEDFKVIKFYYMKINL